MTDVAYLVCADTLVEVVAEDVVRNFGLAGGHLRYVIVRDCRTEDVRTLSGRALADCVPVGERRAAA